MVAHAPRLAYPLTPRDHEPAFDTTEIRIFGERDPVGYVMRCTHANVLPVETGGEVIAHLCIDCDTQLP